MTMAEMMDNEIDMVVGGTDSENAEWMKFFESKGIKEKCLWDCFFKVYEKWHKMGIKREDSLGTYSGGGKNTYFIDGKNMTHAEAMEYFDKHL